MEIFLNRMKEFLKNDFEFFYDALQKEAVKGLRVNRLLCSLKKWEEIAPWSLQPIPGVEDGFYIEKKGAWHHPYHHAGVFYLQDPSAMMPVNMLDPQPGERILDLCASPGGKSSQIASQMRNQGILMANEMVPGRIPSLRSTIERMGIQNTVITNESPDWFSQHFRSWFDRILVDAPCSGEGMFRKNPQAVRDWSIEHVKSCAKRQAVILSHAAPCLRPGGTLVYSTCTFSPEENEEVVQAFLQSHPDFYLEPCAVKMGRESSILKGVWRIYPQHGGEGQCMAKFKRKDGLESGEGNKKKGASQKKISAFSAFWNEMYAQEPPPLWMKGENGYILPASMPVLPKGKVICCGVYAGKLHKNRWIPSHHLFRAFQKTRKDKTIPLSLAKEERLIRDYIRGREIALDTDGRGWRSVKIDGFPLGLGKASGGKIKNHYPKGLRESD